jgi:hypothetical protein
MRLIFLTLLLFTVFTSRVFGDAVIFSGSDVKALKYNLDLFGRSKLLALNSDPTSGGGQSAPLGSIGMDYLTGNVYIKTGAGATAWTSITGSIVSTANRAAQYNGSGVLSASSVTSTELGYVSGVTSAIQTQIDAKVAKSTLTAKGDILTATASGTPAVLNVGTNDYLIQADSAASTGLSYIQATSTATANKVVKYDSSGNIRTGVATSGGTVLYGINGGIYSLAGALLGDITGGIFSASRGVRVGNTEVNASFDLLAASGGTFHAFRWPSNNAHGVLTNTTGGTGAWSDTPTLGTAGSVLGTLSLTGNTSGTVTIQPQAAAGTYNFNLPTSAGSSGQMLTSAGGGSSPMTWVTPLSNPMTSTGDTIYSSDNSGTVARLGIGSSYQQLSVISGLPAWVTDSQSYQLWNVGLSVSVGSNAMTVALKQSDGSTNCSSSAPCIFGFRSATATAGGYSQRAVTGSLSVVVSSGSTLGHASGVATYDYVYAIDNAGTVELAVSRSPFACDEGSVVSTTAEGGAGAADSNRVLYSTTARSNVACRLIGRVYSNQTTAGTWASSPTEVSLIPFDKEVVAFVAEKQTPTSISSSGDVTKFGTVTKDSFNAYDTSNGRYTFISAGWYTINAMLEIKVANVNADTVTYPTIRKNSTTVLASALKNYTVAYAGSTYSTLNLSGTFYFSAGDYFDIPINWNTTPANALTNDVSGSSMSVYMVPKGN